MKLATIDIGSNSIHLLIVEVDDDGHFRPIDRERDMVRLGSHGLTEGHLAPDAIARAVNALTHFAELARAHGCERIIATGTSAVREADNGDSFLRRVRKRTGIAVDLLSGVEEARLIALAVNYVRDLGDTPTLGIDIGGGSTEFWITRGGKNRLLVSNRLGSVRLSERYMRTDPPAKRDIERLREGAVSVLARTSREVAGTGFENVIVTSGTALTLAAMAQALDREQAGGPDQPPLETEGLELTAKDLKRIVKLVTRLPLKERQRIAGLPAERADIIVAGAVLLDTIYDELGIRSAQTSGWALREGVLINYLTSRFPSRVGAVPAAGAQPDPLEMRDIRRRSVLALARRCEFDSGHAYQTAKLAKQIFDQTTELHGLNGDSRELLEAAAVLHDVGYSISHTGHSEHAQYLIMNSEMLGFSSREQSIVGSVARYHQHSLPKKDHTEYARLRTEDKIIVKRLAAILRLADALDRGSRAAVGAVEVEVRKRRVLFRVTSDRDCHLELWAAKRKAGLFDRVYDRSAVFEMN